MLDGLPFHRADDAEPDGGADPAAQLREDKKPGHGKSFESQPGGDGPEDRREVAGSVGFQNGRTQLLQFIQAKRPFCRRQQGAALGAAGAVGDVVGGEGIAERVDCGEVIGLGKGGVDEGQGTLGKLSQGGFEKG